MFVILPSGLLCFCPNLAAQMPVAVIRPMTFKPHTFLLVALAGWMNRQQQEVIQYLRVENQILREKLGRKRLILNDSQKRAWPRRPWTITRTWCGQSA